MLYGSLRSLDIRARIEGRYFFSKACEYWIYRSSAGSSLDLPSVSNAEELAIEAASSVIVSFDRNGSV